MSDYQQKGLIYVISAPSGAGKTSLVNALLNQLSWVDVCVSHTTRTPREGEQDGREYYFVNQQRFTSYIDQGQLIEYARVFNNYYGTSKAEIDRITGQGKDVLLEIDWQGARQVKALYPERAISIFILPPSIEVLKTRLTARGKDAPEVIEARMHQAEDEIKHCKEYAYIIVNHQFNEALKDLESILRVERMKFMQKDYINDMVKQLVGS